MHRFMNCEILIVLNLTGCVSYSFCYCKGSELSLMKFSAVGNSLAIVFVQNHSSYL